MRGRVHAGRRHRLAWNDVVVSFSVREAARDGTAGCRVGRGCAEMLSPKLTRHTASGTSSPPPSPPRGEPWRRLSVNERAQLTHPATEGRATAKGAADKRRLAVRRPEMREERRDHLDPSLALPPFGCRDFACVCRFASISALLLSCAEAVAPAGSGQNSAGPTVTSRAPAERTRECRSRMPQRPRPATTRSCRPAHRLESRRSRSLEHARRDRRSNIPESVRRGTVCAW